MSAGPPSADGLRRFGWLFPAAYFLHLLDERFWPPGTAVWATTHTPLSFTNEAWLAVNVASMALLFVTSRGFASGRTPGWVGVAIAVHLAMHALTRVAGSIGSGTLAPGTLTGVVLCLPVSIAFARCTRRSFDGRSRAIGGAVGIASFQPIWHGALHVLFLRG